MEETPLTLPVFTPTRFSILALCAALIAYAAGSHTQPAAWVDLAQVHRSAGALGQDNGTLTSNLFLAAYTPARRIQAPQQHGTTSASPTPQTTPRHDDQPPPR